MNEDIATSICRTLEARKGDRQPFEAGWKECLDYSFPERGNGIQTSIITPEETQTKKNRILDDTAPDSARMLAAALVSGTTPANSIWFSLAAGDMEDSEDEQAEDDEHRWLDDSARVIFQNIHATSFDAQAYECCIDMVPVGWFVLYIDEAEGGGYQFEQWPVGECFVASSKAGGPVDSIYREVELTVEQMVTTYGMDNVSNAVREAYQQEKYNDKIKVCHAIYPRKIHAVGAQRSRNLPFASCHVEIATKHKLRESGYHEFPCVVPRWMLVPGSAYATGPMSMALGSIRTINDIKAMELMALDIAVGGMWIAEDDGVLNPRAVKLGPRKVIVANSVDSMKELRSASNFEVAFTSEERLQAAIRKILLADQLQPQDGPAMTATEVHVRVQLLRQLLGPIYGRLQAEYLQPLVLRCFGIAYRAGILGTAPQSIQDRILSVRFISPLARAQQLQDVTAMDRMETTLMQEAQIDPSVIDVYDFEAAARQRAQFLGVPYKVMRKPADVDKVREARKKAQADQQQQAMAAQLGQTAGEAIINKVAA